MLFKQKIHTHHIFPQLAILILFLLNSLFSAFVYAEDLSINSTISFDKPWVRLLPPTVMNTAGYVTINNSSNKPEKLLRVWSPTLDSVSVHQTKEENGLFKMLPVNNLVLPANGQIKMQPGSYHIMLMGLDTPLTAESTITICFEFENSGIMHVVFPVSKTQIK